MSAPTGPNAAAAARLEEIRDRTTAMLTHLLAERDAIAGGSGITFDLEEAKRQAEDILNLHGEAIVELPVSAMFDLIALRTTREFEPTAYAAMIKAIDDAALIDEIAATADIAAGAAGRTKRRKELTAAAVAATVQVVQGILFAALMAAGQSLAQPGGGQGGGRP